MANKKDLRTVSNLQIGEDYVLVHANTKFYPRDTVFYASYVFLDRAHVILDGDPEAVIVVELRPKDSRNLEDLGREFNNEMLSHLVYKQQYDMNKNACDAVFQEVCAGVESSEVPICSSHEDLQVCNETIGEMDYTGDPLGIARPWEEVHGKKEEVTDDNPQYSYLDDPLGIAKPWEEQPGRILKDTGDMANTEKLGKHCADEKKS